VGVYGLFSSFVVQRTREIGVRMALGAQRREVLWLVLRRGLGLALLGAGVGVLVALAVVPMVTAMVAGLPTRDPWAMLLLAALLVLVALFACWLPARRAARLEPQVALRQE
jgi:ABC-type antimicrobial peptide transport system permease subunit